MHLTTVDFTKSGTDGSAPGRHFYVGFLKTCQDNYLTYAPDYSGFHEKRHRQWRARWTFLCRVTKYV